MGKRRSRPFQSSSPGGGLSCVPAASAEIAILQGCHPCLFQGSSPDGGPSCVPVASVGIAILQGRRTRQFQGSWPGGGPSYIPVASAEIAILLARWRSILCSFSIRRNCDLAEAPLSPISRQLARWQSSGPPLLDDCLPSKCAANHPKSLAVLQDCYFLSPCIDAANTPTL